MLVSYKVLKFDTGLLLYIELYQSFTRFFRINMDIFLHLINLRKHSHSKFCLINLLLFFRKFLLREKSFSGVYKEKVTLFFIFLIKEDTELF